MAGTTRAHELLRRDEAQVLAVHPLELLRIEDRRLLLQPVGVEQLDHLVSVITSMSLPGDQPSSARKLSIAPGRMPRCW